MLTPSHFLREHPNFARRQKNGEFIRDVEYEGKIYAEVPEAVIRKAALKAMGIADS